MQGGTFRWMGPELLNPQRFGFKDSRPTRHSDCYALGMVVYEVLSRRVPFYQDADLVVVVHVAEGKRPDWPRGAEGAWFTDDVWMILERCWTRKPWSRPSTKDVLQCVEKASRSWIPLPPWMITGAPTTDLFSWNSSDSSIEGSTTSSSESSEYSSPTRRSFKFLSRSLGGNSDARRLELSRRRPSLRRNIFAPTAMNPLFGIMTPRGIRGLADRNGVVFVRSFSLSGLMRGGGTGVLWDVWMLRENAAIRG